MCKEQQHVNLEVNKSYFFFLLSFAAWYRKKTFFFFDTINCHCQPTQYQYSAFWMEKMQGSEITHLNCDTCVALYWSESTWSTATSKKKPTPTSYYTEILSNVMADFWLKCLKYKIKLSRKASRYLTIYTSVVIVRKLYRYIETATESHNKTITIWPQSQS